MHQSEDDRTAQMPQFHPGTGAIAGTVVRKKERTKAEPKGATVVTDPSQGCITIICERESTEKFQSSAVSEIISFFMLADPQ